MPATADTRIAHDEIMKYAPNKHDKIIYANPNWRSEGG